MVLQLKHSTSAYKNICRQVGGPHRVVSMQTKAVDKYTFHCFKREGGAAS